MISAGSAGGALGQDMATEPLSGDEQVGSHDEGPHGPLVGVHKRCNGNGQTKADGEQGDARPQRLGNRLARLRDLSAGSLEPLLGQGRVQPPPAASHGELIELTEVKTFALDLGGL